MSGTHDHDHDHDHDDETPPLANVIELPRDPDEAATHLMRLTKQSKDLPFWVAKPRRWYHGDYRPEGTREYPEVAMVYLPHALFAQGRIELRYKDGHRCQVMLSEVSQGLVVLPGEVAEQWVMCGQGHIDLRGRRHEA